MSISTFAIKRVALVASLVMTLGLTSTPTMAQTPDGETPANEGVCDVVQGGSPGLYGLCVAYCEAQDLDDFEKEPPRTKILANYRKKMKAGDPDMPCLQVPCPCVSDEELNAIAADGLAACISLDTVIRITDDLPAGNTRLADTDIAEGRERCRYLSRIQGEPTIFRSFRISAEEAQSCYAAISDACNLVGN